MTRIEGLPSNGTWVATADGRAYWPLELRPADVRIEDIAHALSNTCRWGGRCGEFYSVAQHCVWVAQRTEEHAPNDPEFVLQALLHDAAEAYLGDLVTPIKRVTSLAGRPYLKVESAALVAIHEALGVAHPEWAHTALIADADARALATEARDLMGGVRWEGMALPLGPTLEPLSPRAARTQFLRMFERLRAAAEANR